MLPLRLMNHVRKSPNGCWHWTGHVSRNGYGQTSVGSRTTGDRRTVLVHRLAYEYHHGAQLVPKGQPGHLQVDHQCHNRSRSCPGGPTCLHRRCVNPAHLQLATPRENTAASDRSSASVNRRKTHCGVCGNDLNGPDVYVYGGKRSCKPCCIRRRNESRHRVKVTG